MRYQRILMIVAVVLLAACGDDPKSSTDTGADLSSDTTTDATTTTTDATTTTEDTADPCAEKVLCPIAGKQCLGDVIVDCALDADGCMVPTPEEDCGYIGMACAEGNPPTCEDPCSVVADPCFINGQMTCDGDQLMICEPNTNACLERKVQVDCAAQDASNSCQSENNTASCVYDPCLEVSNCSVVNAACNGTELTTCSPNVFDCLVETVVECGTACDAAMNPPCTPSGTCAELYPNDSCDVAGEAACDGTALRKCQNNAFGCLVWQTLDCTAAAGRAASCEVVADVATCVID